MLRRRDCLKALGATALPWLWARPAAAATLRGLTLGELTKQAERVGVARAVQAESRWEQVSGSPRIVTLTRFQQETDFKRVRAVDERSEDEFFTLTLGGRVGTLGQKVPGEAVIPVGSEALLFLSPEQNGHRRILGMAQGAYRTRAGSSGRVLTLPPSLPRLLGTRRGADAEPRERFAVDVLAGRSLAEAFELIRGAQ